MHPREPRGRGRVSGSWPQSLRPRPEDADRVGHVVRRDVPQVGQCERRLAVAAVGDSEQREQRRVLRDGEQLPVRRNAAGRLERRRGQEDLAERARLAGRCRRVPDIFAEAADERVCSRIPAGSAARSRRPLRTGQALRPAQVPVESGFLPGPGTGVASEHRRYEPCRHGRRLRLVLGAHPGARPGPGTGVANEQRRYEPYVTGGVCVLSFESLSSSVFSTVRIAPASTTFVQRSLKPARNAITTKNSIDRDSLLIGTRLVCTSSERTTPETAPIKGRKAPSRRTPSDPSSWSIVKVSLDIRMSTLTTAPTPPAAMAA